MKQILLFLALCISTNGCTLYAKNFASEYYRSEAERAEALEKKNQYLQAIQAYERHILIRLESGKLYANENPYFYKLLIGDLLLKLDKPEQAEAAYLVALEKEVSKPLSSDRLKKLGHWYEKQGDFDKAIEIVTKHRELDTLLFDLEIDRLHKARVEYERQLIVPQEAEIVEQ